jgi:hypothetical protein
MMTVAWQLSAHTPAMQDSDVAEFRFQTTSSGKAAH